MHIQTEKPSINKTAQLLWLQSQEENVCYENVLFLFCLKCFKKPFVF